MVAGNTVFSFRCTACGGCCNSPPLLSLPELFRFQEVFIGCLAVRRLGAAGEPRRAALLDALAFRAAGPAGATHIAIMPQGYGFESEPHCPALSQDGRCALQARNKPAQCRAVPLDPLAPEERQASVLRERMADPVFGQAGCLATGEDASRDPLTLHGRVADPAYAAAVDERRTDLAADRRIWGGAVFDMLRREAPALLAVPAGGFMALSMAPALLVVAAVSPACRARCRDFLQAQQRLIGSAVEQARRRRRAGDRPVTRRLAAWSQDYHRLAAALEAQIAPMPASPALRAEVMAWLDGETIPA